MMKLLAVNSFVTKSSLRTYKTRLKLEPLGKKYLPNVFDDVIYKYWRANEFFPRESSNAFSMILPPPNVTGTLHLGHALTATIQDTIARWRRMGGCDVTWIPGTDHAGIATQAIVEKVLSREGLSRHSLGREQFLGEVWKWKESKGQLISQQLGRLGASLDWTREYFTMDEAQSKAVYEALSRLWSRGLIYRDNTLVNWSPALGSTISDIEVNKLEVDGPTWLSIPGYEKPIEFGKMVDFAYKVLDSEAEVVVSTSRVETMLGDVAVAVHPSDDRYRSRWGSLLVHPFTRQHIPLVLDYSVDPHFGTGALKVTPAHDRRDFLIGKSHNLPSTSVINEDGLLINSAQFTGMKRFEAREAITKALADLELLRGSRPHKMAVPICSRTGDVIEQIIKPQWFLKCSGMAEKAISAVKERKLTLKPERYEENWFNWLENIQDWCISRQLWWGHQVPFYCVTTQEEGSGAAREEAWFLAPSQVAAEEVARDALQRHSAPPVRCSDVLDTWFSSALLPFSSLGWPQKTDSFQKYYPLDVLVTGNDILFFWVARMVMLGLELTHQLPFKEVLLHGIICDYRGRKMSKSLGNVIDPMDVIEGRPLDDLLKRLEGSHLGEAELKNAKEDFAKLFPNGISECGVDALRFTLLSSNIKSQYINFDIKECEGVKRFCNKLWQVTNFANKWNEKYPEGKSFVLDFKSLRNIMNKWILLRLSSTLETVQNSLSCDDFHIATSAIRNFIHHDFCDVYVESIKRTLQGSEEEAGRLEVLSCLNYVLKTSLSSLSVFMPFLSEQLYNSLHPGKSVMEEKFPSPIDQVSDPVIEKKISFALEIVSAIRRLKKSHGLGDRHIAIRWESTQNISSDLKQVIEVLGRCEIKLESLSDVEVLKYEIINEDCRILLDLRESQGDIKSDISSLLKKSAKLKKDLEKLHKMLSNEGYQKVDPSIQKSHQEKIFKLKAELEKIESLLAVERSNHSKEFKNLSHVL